MALYKGRLLMRGGNEADFDPDKMIPREWGVSTDKGIVRICIKPGVCIRMATYDAFEEDMAKIEEILKTCQTIQEAVIRINTEVSQNADAVAEYTAQAKQYRDEAKQFRDEAFATTPDGYAEVVENVEKNTVKIDTIIEKADLGIKETASGEEIHLTDSAESKAVEFALYGKATQDGEPTPENPVDIVVSGESYNLLENTATSQTINGVTFTVNEDKSVTVNGTTTETTSFTIYRRDQPMFLDTEKNYILSSGSKLATGVFLQLGLYSGGAYTDTISIGNGNISEKTISLNTNIDSVTSTIVINKGVTVNNLTFYPMIRKASVKNDRYMPYGKGSVEVKSVGNQLANLPDIEAVKISGISWSCKNGAVTASGTATDRSSSSMGSLYYYLPKIESGTYFVSGSTANTKVFAQVKNSDGTFAYPENRSFSLEGNEISVMVYCQVEKDEVVDETIYPMLNKGTTALPFEPYKETTATIPTTDFAGIKVDSGGNYIDSNGQQWIANEIVKYADGSGEHVQRVLKTVFDGSDDEGCDQLSSEFGLRFNAKFEKSILNSDKSNGVLSMNSNFQITSSGGTYTNANTYTIANNTIHISLNGNESLTEFKEYLATKPMTVLAVLATPIRTPLTAEEIAEIEKIFTFYPVTNISNDFDCGMKVTYLCDSKNYIDSKIAELATAMVNNI